MQLTTPGRVVVDRDIAGVGTRMLAQAIDLPLIVAVELGVVFIGGMLSAGSESLALVFMIVVGAVVPFVYFIVPEGRGRQTPGKKALRVHVVTGHRARVEGVMQVSDACALLEDIDDQRRASEQLRAELLLVLAVRADASDERAGGHVVRSEQRMT